ncbi:unnamed protein product, partial [Polarella glacialis]
DTPFWRTVKANTAMMNVSRTYGQDGNRPDSYAMEDMLRHLRSWIGNRKKWLEDKTDCPCGALAVIDLAVTQLDLEDGEEQAKLAYSLRLELAAERQWRVQSLEVEDGAGTSSWKDLSLVHEYVPRLLGLGGGHACHGTALRIFVYKLPSLAHMTKPVLKCSQKMAQCTASVHIHRWLESGKCITEDPEE